MTKVGAPAYGGSGRHTACTQTACQTFGDRGRSADASRAVMSAPTKPDREPDTSSVNGGGEKPSEAACGRHRQTPFAVSTWSRRHMAPGCLHLGR